MAEWIDNDDGGCFCSECGFFHDDYLCGGPPKQCNKCGAKMSKTTLTVDREYRLSRLEEIGYCKDEEYPKWLLDLKENKNEILRRDE